MTIWLICGALVMVVVTAAITWPLAQGTQARREQANVDLVPTMWDGVINRADRDAEMA